MSVLSIERIDVGETRVEALVRVAEPALKTSTFPGLSARAFAALPGLVRHSCHNDAGVDLRRELADTETAHLLEHVAFELMALSGSPRTLRGKTRWDFARDGRGTYHVELDYDDDLVAIGALKAAAEVVEWLVSGEGAAPDIDAEVARLAGLRRS